MGAALRHARPSPLPQHRPTPSSPSENVAREPLFPISIRRTQLHALIQIREMDMAGTSASIAGSMLFKLGMRLAALAAGAQIAFAASMVQAAPVVLDTAYGVNGVAAIGAGPSNENLSAV